MQDDKENPSLLLISFKVFLEEVPPGKLSRVEKLGNPYATGPKLPPPNPQPSYDTYLLNPPDLELYCETCKGIRLFTRKSDQMKLLISVRRLNLVFVVFECRNCEKSIKAYALQIKWMSGFGEQWNRKPA